MIKILGLALLVALAGCSKTKVSPQDEAPALETTNPRYTITQNGSLTVDLGPRGAEGLTITRLPAYGRITIDGNKVTYRASNPLYSGDDSFDYKYSLGAGSAQGTVGITLLPLGSGTISRAAYALTGWRSYSSGFGHGPQSVAELQAGVRRFRVAGDVAAYAGDSTYQSRFGALPVDGSGFAMKDWPWMADLIHVPECGVDATVTLKIQPLNNEYPMAAVLLNYDIDAKTVGGQTLTGYQLLVNGGGGSLTLSRFNGANELATAFIDRWPNTNYGGEAGANPVSHGPYRGWNYRNGAWPAGGNVGVGGAKYLAVRYQYGVTTGKTVISYEARPGTGIDFTPGVWDVSVTLTGADSLPPGGSFGIMALNYHAQSMLLTTDFEVSDYKLECTLP